MNLWQPESTPSEADSSVRSVCGYHLGSCVVRKLCGDCNSRAAERNLCFEFGPVLHLKETLVVRNQ